MNWCEVKSTLFNIRHMTVTLFARILMQICNSIYSSFMWEGQEGNRIIMAKMHAMFRHSAIFFRHFRFDGGRCCIYFAGVKLQFILKIISDTGAVIIQGGLIFVLKVNRFIKTSPTLWYHFIKGVFKQRCFDTYGNLYGDNFLRNGC